MMFDPKGKKGQTIDLWIVRNRCVFTVVYQMYNAYNVHDFAEIMRV